MIPVVGGYCGGDDVLLGVFGVGIMLMTAMMTYAIMNDNSYSEKVKKAEDAGLAALDKARIEGIEIIKRAEANGLAKLNQAIANKDSICGYVKNAYDQCLANNT